VSPRWAWLFDIGSTFTKLTVVDLDDPSRHLRAQAPTTVATDVRTGFLEAIAAVEAQGVHFAHAAVRRASSSAAGGLALAVSGLVPRLSAEAGRMAALGAGAKLVRSMSYRLTSDDITQLEECGADVVLLTGGTDGGDRGTLLANAAKLAEWPGCPAVIVAGNREAAPEALAILESAGRRAIRVDNILPEIDRLAVAGARNAIRHEFLENIVHAKGIDRVRPELDGDILPTPGVVLDGVELLGRTAFPGGLMAVEVGGATTNVHSWCELRHAKGVVTRGLPEPVLKRTVEGDLGVRWNADTIHDLAGPGWFADASARNDSALRAYVTRLRANPSLLPVTPEEERIDSALATYAASIAVSRHCGRHHEVHLPTGPVTVQDGKDLRSVSTLIGTGGSVIAAAERMSVLAEALRHTGPLALVPSSPAVLTDSRYALYACGLLVGVDEGAAVELVRLSCASTAPAAAHI
jgi:uncharacterized protein (TIGR01319 family)